MHAVQAMYKADHHIMSQGSVIFSEGDPGDAFYVLVEGKAPTLGSLSWHRAHHYDNLSGWAPLYWTQDLDWGLGVQG